MSDDSDWDKILKRRDFLKALIHKHKTYGRRTQRSLVREYESLEKMVARKIDEVIRRMAQTPQHDDIRF